MPDTPAHPQQQFPLEFDRHENYENWYSNNIQYQQSEWDLKMIFGQLDWRNDRYVVEQHTAVSVAWLQAKLLLYYLSIQVDVYEMSHGRISVPPGALPPEPTPPAGELKDDPLSNQIYEYIKKRREQFIAEPSR